MRIAAITLVALTLAFTASGQTRQEAPFRDGAWRIEAAESRIETYRGREALLLQNGVAWLDAGLRDGSIEFDLAVTGERGFSGLAFRAVDDSNYEHVYIRPHQSGNEDATQYTPVFNGGTGWQIYLAPEFGGAIDIDRERWMHVRVVVQGRRMRLSVDGQERDYHDLIREPQSGGIGLTSTLSAARFANVVVTRGASGDLAAAKRVETPPPSPGVIARWRVSTPFPESRLNPLQSLDPAAWKPLQWATLPSGPRGIANLAMARKRAPEANTVFAAATLRARKAMTARVRIAFSDRVVAYLNGRPLFRGDDKYQSRDYRFLGSVGFFDELILPLAKGDNELWLAVSEDFGGWAAGAQVVDGEGVEVVSP